MVTEMNDESANEALLRPVRSGNVFEETVNRLLQLVWLGVYEPGDALPPERELASKLGVGRDTVRQAIKSLSDAEYFTTKRGRYGGTFFADTVPRRHSTVSRRVWTPADIADLLGMREVLEVGAIRLASRRTLTAVERDVLWMRLSEVEQAGPDDYRRLDARLHLTFAELAGVRTLTPLLADNRMALNELLDQIPLLGPNIAHSNHQHRAAAMAVLTGDESGAAGAMQEHLSGTAALLHGFLDGAPTRQGNGDRDATDLVETGPHGPPGLSS